MLQSVQYSSIQLSAIFWDLRLLRTSLCHARASSW